MKKRIFFVFSSCIFLLINTSVVSLEYITTAPMQSAHDPNIDIIDMISQVNEDMLYDYLKNLTDFGPRFTGTENCTLAAQYIYNEFESYGLEVRYDDWTYSGYSGNNIEGTKIGTNETSDAIYLICAHYDSVSNSPGADDDGSGTAAVLAAAYLLSQYEFNHTIRFVAFDGEEQGLLGSHEYAEEASNNGDNIVAVLNGDMIGYAEDSEQASYIKIYEDSASEWITDATQEISQLYFDYLGLTIVPSGVAYNSDHASFWTYDFNAIMYHEYEFNYYYHTPQDTIENMNITYATKCSKLVLATLASLGKLSSDAPLTPEISGETNGIAGQSYDFTIVLFCQWQNGRQLIRVPGDRIDHGPALMELQSGLDYRGISGINADGQIHSLLNNLDEPGKLFRLLFGIKSQPRIHVQKGGSCLGLPPGQVLDERCILCENGFFHCLSGRIDFLADDLHSVLRFRGISIRRIHDNPQKGRRRFP